MKLYNKTVLASAILTLVVACEKAPEEVRVESVSLGQPTAEMLVGESVQLSATVLPSNATDKTVIWTSSKQSVATISTSGLVKAVSDGTSTITASAGGKSATCIVTVSKSYLEVSSITLNKQTLSLEKGVSETLTTTILPSDATNKAVIWSSSDSKVASVEQNGEVTAVGGGTAVIMAKADKQMATCAVTVTVPVTSISLDCNSITLVEGDSMNLVVTVNPSDASDKSVIWSSSNTSISTVDQSGRVTAIREGSVTITAKAGDKQASCSVVVKKKIIAVTSITLNTTELYLIKGQSETLIATVKPDNATDKSVMWSSLNTDVATVDQSGHVKAIAKGQTIVTAKSGEQSTTCKVIVKNQVPVGAVDLGLRVYWATCNLGASCPEDSGDYYCWGELETKTILHNWENYRFCSSGKSYSYVQLSKYNTVEALGPVDNNTVLDVEDDVANYLLGGDWKMPTQQDYTELNNNCTVAWKTINGRRGIELTSKINGNSIFFPAAGENFYLTPQFTERCGYYWTADLAAEPRRARLFKFDYDYFSIGVYATLPRCEGLSIRAVCE